MTSLLTVIGGWLVTAIIMIVLWRRAETTKNAGFVDVAWTFATGGLGAIFALGGDGDLTRRVILAGLILAWCGRLGVYLFRRIRGEAGEDVRYRGLREQWGDHASRNLFWLFQAQATWAVLFALPLLVAGRNAAPFGGVLDGLGLGVWIAAIAGEAVADRQLARFRANRVDPKTICKEGLWRYSRHPNYFFEWVHWFAYVLLAWMAPYGWLALGGPVVMFLFIVKLTGIPPVEARSVDKYGDVYREYQRTTSALIPWPPRKSTT